MHDPASDGGARLRVLLVDADERIRESLAGLLSIGDRVTVVGATGDPGDALALLTATQPDVVVIDPRLPEVDRGRALIGRLRRAAPHVRVLVLGRSDGIDPSFLACDADAFARKTFRPSELVEAIMATPGRTPHR